MFKCRIVCDLGGNGYRDDLDKLLSCLMTGSRYGGVSEAD